LMWGNASSIPSCSWEKIQASGELRRMSRQHIHFASEPRHLRADDWACVLLEVGTRGLPGQHSWGAAIIA
jgi:hypothetical protein